uniref:Uncharacterized protein n=1 Tax=Arundo donax TaxID=35708 RepID=A0A0A8ZE86_ARUDO
MSGPELQIRSRSVASPRMAPTTRPTYTMAGFSRTLVRAAGPTARSNAEKKLGGPASSSRGLGD